MTTQKKTYISFVEEAVMNPDYRGYIGGRIEVHRPEDRGYHSEEIRFFTDEPEKFNAFRDKYDMKEVTKEQLEAIKEIVRLYFMETS
ncbi:hypothetical protein [Candidatus Magnetobacterium casense]|uniref:Uncharacterized protein n=1 Tax=Candidatus Magnetobacterium casense TaxID=1455061 RepID=A0ABS6S3K0_9BACT|nr:hypothetical protein [Candidatus Magnetobacterium casensis]MBV6343416.1 hypothetical protein [Candidatus Magnetobacterium casensis]